MMADLLFYLDENLPPRLAEGLQLLATPLAANAGYGLSIKSLKKEFGAGTLDEEWIPVVGQQGGVVITQDFNIHETKHQFELCQRHKLGMIYIKSPSKKGWTYWEMVCLLVNHWAEIVAITQKNKPPFSFRYTPRAKFQQL